MDIEIRHARIVTVIAEVGSISKAAVELNLPQPSLTMQLRRIEKAIGGELFVRSKDGVTPTRAGRRLIPMLTDLVERRNGVLTEAARLGDDRPPLRVGNIEWTPSGLRAEIRAALDMYDVTTMTVDVTAASEMVRKGVLGATLTMGSDVVAPAPTGGEIRSAVVATEPVWVAVRADHPLLADGHPSLPDLAELTWVRHAPSHWFHEIEARLFARFGPVQPTVLHHVGGHAEAMSWVRETGAAAMITPTGASPEVGLAPIPDTELAELRCVWRTDEVHERAIRRMVRAVQKYYCEYAQSYPEYWTWMNARREDPAAPEFPLPRIPEPT